MRGSELRSADTTVGVGSDDDQPIAIDRLAIEQDRILGGQTIVDPLDSTFEPGPKRPFPVGLGGTALAHRITDRIDPSPYT
jgi:hypothetical protein